MLEAEMIEFDDEGLDNFITDEDCERNGLWIDQPGNRSFLVRRAGGANIEFQKSLQRVMSAYRGMDVSSLDVDTQQELMFKIYLHSVIVDWKGIKDKQGNEIPYSYNVAVVYFKKFPNLYDYLKKCSENINYFNKARLEEIKNEQGVL